MPPAVVGVLFLGDTARHGFIGLAALGFILAVICALALARFGEAGDESKSESAEEQPHDLSLRRAALRNRELPEHS
jgi:hypothetical protein